MLRAVLVDVGGTLWPDRLTVKVPDSMFVEQVARIFPSIDSRDALAALRTALRQDSDKIVQNTHSILRTAIQRFGADCTDAEAVAVRRALCAPAWPYVSLFPGAVAFLKGVRRLGIRCVALSNVEVRGAAEYHRDFADLGVGHLIDAVVTSLDVGYRKPHRAMFEAGLHEAGCSPDVCAMLGDSEAKDILPAVALGMRAIRVAIEEPAPASSAAHAVVSDLLHARDILVEWTITNA